MGSFCPRTNYQGKSEYFHQKFKYPPIKWQENFHLVYKICDLLWRNREQVARLMFLIITCTLSYDQYRHYSMHSAIHNDTHHWWCAFMSDSFYDSQCKPLLLKGSSTVSTGMPWVIVFDKNSMHCWFILKKRNLSLRLVHCFARAGHIYWPVRSWVYSWVSAWCTHFLFSHVFWTLWKC